MRLLILLLIAPVCLAASAEPACTVNHYTAPNAAEKALYAGKTDEALVEYEKLLAASPNDPVLVAGAVLAHLRKGELDAVAALLDPALHAKPDNVRLLVAKGNLEFRQGHISDADKSYAAAGRADPCSGLVYLGAYRVARVSSMGATATRKLALAHSLDPEEPQIRSAWLRSRPLAERVALARHDLDQAKDLSDEEKARREHRIESMQIALDAQQHTCQSDPLAKPADIALAPIMFDANNLNTWGLEATVNGHTSRLVLDTGASGFYIGRSQAQAMGLKPVVKTLAGGFGDKGPQSGYIAFADSITIGGLTFRNCQVEVSDRRSVVGSDGLIGANVFAQYMITIDYPAHKLQLDALPHSTSQVVAASSGTDDEDDDSASAVALTDRYEGPELKGFSPFYLFNTKVLMPTLINNKGPFLFVLDTGDAFLNVEPEAAAQAGIKYSSAVSERYDGEGISGRSHNRFADNVDLRFAGAYLRKAEVAITTLNGMSQGLGTQVAGFVGAPALRYWTIHLDYRDGMLKFDYDSRNDHRDHRLDGYDNACAMYGQCGNDK